MAIFILFYFVWESLECILVCFIYLFFLFCSKLQCFRLCVILKSNGQSIRFTYEIFFFSIRLLWSASTYKHQLLCVIMRNWCSLRPLSFLSLCCVCCCLIYYKLTHEPWDCIKGLFRTLGCLLDSPLSCNLCFAFAERHAGR